ncbi:hypothetical protein VNO78_26489 [Psophocarpus tetragonolobus]|uniref:Uncharacterized protein n=1 Tax=Psophocarpus tetragonolobus TaxID=3891 RepID=A0AAN9RZF2_PSOTE
MATRKIRKKQKWINNSLIFIKRKNEYISKNDSAFKGKLDGVELLIFPANCNPKSWPCISVGRVGDKRHKPNKDVEGKKQMEKNNSADRPESSRQPSLSFASPTSCEGNLNMHDWQAAEILFSL